MPRNRFNVIDIIRYEIKTGFIKKYSRQMDTIDDGFDSPKVGGCCREKIISHRNYFWFYEKNFCLDSLKNRFILYSKPKRVPNVLPLKKICNKCKLEKNIDCFGNGDKKTGSRRSDCKQCRMKYISQRRFKDPKFRLSLNLRKRLNAALTRKKWNKNSFFNQYIGCSLEILKEHIEKQFNHNMSWENYGIYWELDHIIPLGSAKTEEELYTLSHFSNLQPLSVSENRKKGGGYSN